MVVATAGGDRGSTASIFVSSLVTLSAHIPLLRHVAPDSKVWKACKAWRSPSRREPCAAA
jgi:hypothetical protein